MNFLGKALGKVADKIGETIADNIGAAIGAGIVTILVSGWFWIWGHFNPLFQYTAPPSALNSHFVSLGQIFNQIDRDSRVYCTGGWDQRLARVGLRTCYHFAFSPLPVYKMIICTHDERTAQVSTSDQLLAFRYFEQRFTPLECFRTVKRSDEDYDVVPGKDSHFHSIKFSNESPHDEAFCGCSGNEIKEIAKTIGAAVR